VATPTFHLEAAFGSRPGDTAYTWTDLSTVARQAAYSRGRNYELDRTQAGQGSFTVQDAVRAFDSTYASSAYYPNVIPLVPVRGYAVIGGTTYYQFQHYVTSWERRRQGPNYADRVISTIDGFELLQKPLQPTRATVTTALGGNRDITYTTVDAGPNGNKTRIRYLATKPFHVNVSGHHIIIYTGASGVTANQIIAEIYNHTEAWREVIPALAPGSNGSGVCTTMAEVACTGGAALAFPVGLSGAHITSALNSIGWPTALRLLGTGKSTIRPITFQPGDSSAALDYIQQVAGAGGEEGMVFIDGRGRVVFLDRWQQAAAPYTVSQVSFTDTPPTYPADEYDVLLIHADGADASTTFTDSATAKAITTNGNAQVDTAQSKFGAASALLDGTGDYLTVSYNSTLDFGTGDFTIDCWVRFNALSAVDYAFFYSAYDTSGADIVWFYLQPSGANFYLSFQGNQSGVGKASYNVLWNPSLNTWYHLAAVRNGMSFAIYINGVSQTLSVSTAIGTNSLSPTTGNTMASLIGSYYGGSFLNGWLDEIRISKGIARWTANFTPPTSAYSGEIPYQDLTPSYDKDLIVNEWTGTRTGGKTMIVTDPPSQLKYLRRPSEISSVLGDNDQLIGILQMRLARFKDPLDRVESIDVMPANSTLAWQKCLAREPGDRVTVKQNPPGGGTEDSREYIVQAVRADIDYANPVASKYTFRLWPADVGNWLILDDTVYGRLDYNRLGA
jgi:hypothetical protein